MKSLAVLILISSTFGTALASKPDKRSSDPAESYQVIDAIYAAYQDYKNKNQKGCVSKLQSLDFQVSKSLTRNIPKDATLDSLVMENHLKERWAYFKSLDLGYLRTINAGFVIRHDHKNELFTHLKTAWINEGKQLDVVNGNTLQKEVIFKGTQEVWIEDDRWKVKTYTKLPSQYTYSITIFDDYLDIEITEVIPKKIVSIDEMSDLRQAKL